MQMRIVLFVLAVLCSAIARAGTIAIVTGEVVDAQGKPVAGARLGKFWIAQENGPLDPFRSAKSEADGRFKLELELYNRDAVVMAVDKTRALGGLAVVSLKEPRKPLRIELAPLTDLRIRFNSEQPGQSLGRVFLSIYRSPGLLQLASCRSVTPAFSVKLPAGRYTLFWDVDERHIRESRDVLLEPGKPLDLGEITIKLSALGHIIGQPAPAWHFTDARGISKDVQPSQFKGKWIVLEFWGYWCGACICRGLPGWFDFAEDHAADRDKFVILTVCDPRTTEFALLDEKLKPIIHRTWRGRSFPFPILLDASGRMVKDYGIPHWPTAILIDPAGRVVDLPRKQSLIEGGAEDFLASKLSPIPTAKRIARALDRDLQIYVDDDQTLAELMDFYSKVARIPIRLDEHELKASGAAGTDVVPLKMSPRHTLRAWLNLTLEPFGLTYIADGEGLRIVRRTAENLALSQPTLRQQTENALVAESLDKKVSLDFHGESLKQMIALLESKTDETFVLDPTARRSGTINPATTVMGSVVDQPLSIALTHILAPLGMNYAVRDEVIVLTIAR
jgi:hypothetical protein